MTQNWQEQGPEIRARILFDLEAGMAERLGIGAERYPGSFLGDPIAQAREEVLDLVYYLAYAERKIEYLDQYRQIFKAWAGTDLTPEEARNRLGL